MNELPNLDHLDDLDRDEPPPAELFHEQPDDSRAGRLARLTGKGE